MTANKSSQNFILLKQLFYYLTISLGQELGKGEVLTRPLSGCRQLDGGGKVVGSYWGLADHLHGVWGKSLRIRKGKAPEMGLSHRRWPISLDSSELILIQLSLGSLQISTEMSHQNVVSKI